MCRIRLLLPLLLALCCSASTGIPDDDDATEGTIRLSIPEPLLFDLVRPLGARIGEVEVNTLLVRPFRETVQWAPEIEVVVGKGIALEFELPFEGAELETWKFAAQGRLPRLPWKRYIHGWQGIAEIPQQRTAHGEVSALYISGVRWSRRVSTLSLNGLKLEGPRTSRRAVALLNNTVFHESKGRGAFGLESNLQLHRRNSAAVLAPQYHQRLPKQFHVQLGVGASWQASRAWQPMVALRLIRELN